MSDAVTHVIVSTTPTGDPGPVDYDCGTDDVQGFVEEHGIRIRYESGADAGTTLHFPWHNVLAYTTRNAEPFSAHSESVSGMGL